MKISALIFGYNDYTSQIAKNVSYKYEDIAVFKQKNDKSRDEFKDFQVETFDLSDDWSDLELHHDISNSVAFCVLEDDAQNIFLTISLRAAFEKLTIIALSKNKESAEKLTMAGANKVIPLVQTTALMIAEMLDKPIVTNVLHNILYEKSSLKVAQVKIEKPECFLKENGDIKYPSEIDWSEEYSVLVLSIIDKDGNNAFIYSSQSKHHPIEKGDLFVVVGYENDIENFEKLIGGDRCQ